MFKPTHRKPKDTEKTIQELKMSIDSIQRMIQKSQQILISSRPMQPRQAPSDSIKLRFNTNSKQKSKSKSKSNYLIQSRLAKLNVTNATTNDATIISDVHSSLQKIKKKPQKTKPQLFIDIDQVEDRRYQGGRNNILIHDIASPVSAIEYNEENFIDSSSFAESVESNFNLVNRFKTENLNDSWENKFFSSSLQKKNDNFSQKQQKKVVLRKKGNTHVRNLTELQQYKSKPKKKIFDTKVAPSRFSKYHQNVTKNDIKKVLKEPKRDGSKAEGFRVATLSSARGVCEKSEKQNNQMDMEQFLKKVKQYGFVDRYLSRSEICCIYEYLKTSSVPEYKWPLYVVDEVYDKMQTPKNNRQ